jgi:hypothetical protein
MAWSTSGSVVLWIFRKMQVLRGTLEVAASHSDARCSPQFSTPLQRLQDNHRKPAVGISLVTEDLPERGPLSPTVMCAVTTDRRP